MKKQKTITLILFIMAILVILPTISSAASLTLDVYFNGGTITLEPENPELRIQSLNLLPGEADTSYLNILNKGSKEIELYTSVKIEDDEANLKDILNFKIIDKNNIEIFSGNYQEVQKTKTIIPEGEEQTYKIVTEMPITAGNEYQAKQCNIIYTFKITGEKSAEVQTPKTGQTILIYSILGAIAIILIVILIKLKIDQRKVEDSEK